MSTIKETTLHPDGNEGVDLYPKTNINQVQELPQKLTSVENQITQLNIAKLTKPTNPSAESAVTMLADGTVGTKPLSELGGGSGGGGKLYIHHITITANNKVIEGNFLSTRGTNYDVTDDFNAYFLPGSTITIDNVKYGIISYSNMPNNGYRAYENFNITTYEESGGQIDNVATFSQYYVTEL